jgi:hypothetical protein
MKTQGATARARFAQTAVSLAAVIAGAAIATPFVLILAAPFIGGW